MKKMIKKILACLVLISSISYAETWEMDLVTFATYTSEANDINILISDELKDENIVFIVNGKQSYLLSAFRKALQLRNLTLAKTPEFWYVKKKEIYIEARKYRSIKLNFVQFEDIKNFLTVFDEDVKFEFIKTSKLLLVRSNSKDFETIYDMIKSIDNLPVQRKL